MCTCIYIDLALLGSARLNNATPMHASSSPPEQLYVWEKGCPAIPKSVKTPGTHNRHNKPIYACTCSACDVRSRERRHCLSCRSPTCVYRVPHTCCRLHAPLTVRSQTHTTTVRHERLLLPQGRLQLHDGLSPAGLQEELRSLLWPDAWRRGCPHLICGVGSSLYRKGRNRGWGVSYATFG